MKEPQVDIKQSSTYSTTKDGQSKHRIHTDYSTSQNTINSWTSTEVKRALQVCCWITLHINAAIVKPRPKFQRQQETTEKRVHHKASKKTKQWENNITPSQLQTLEDGRLQQLHCSYMYIYVPETVQILRGESKNSIILSSVQLQWHRLVYERYRTSPQAGLDYTDKSGTSTGYSRQQRVAG